MNRAGFLGYYLIYVVVRVCFRYCINGHATKACPQWRPLHSALGPTHRQRIQKTKSHLHPASDLYTFSYIILSDPHTPTLFGVSCRFVLGKIAGRTCATEYVDRDAVASLEADDGTVYYIMRKSLYVANYGWQTWPATPGLIASSRADMILSVRSFCLKNGLCHMAARKSSTVVAALMSLTKAPVGSTFLACVCATSGKT